MTTGFTPYFWMAPGWGAWLELTPDTSHAALVAVAGRLCREFGGVVTERLDGTGDSKEYWWVRVSGATLLLMRKPPGVGAGLAADPRDVELLIRLGRAWGVGK